MKYSLATSSFGEEEVKAINDVVKSNNYSMGPKVKEFEENFAAFFGTKYAIMCNSGSSANLLMIASLFFTKNVKLKRGDEIIVPAVSWSTTYTPLQQYGLHVKFIDIDPDTLNFNLKDLANAVTERTKVILAVNLLGNPNDFDRINEIIGIKDILLLEDNCESMGAKYKNKFTGSLGIMGTFSTFFSHHISTMEGGLVITDNEELYHIMLSLRAHGWTRNLPQINQLSNKSKDDFKESFRFLLPGYNLRPVEMSGAIGIEQLKKLPKFIEQRRNNAALFISLFEGDKRFKIQKEIEVSSWFGFSFIIQNNASRDDIIRTLNQANIDVRPIVTGDFTKNEVLDYFDYSIYGNLDNSKHLEINGFFIGNSHEDLTKELNYLKSIL